jgi:hypothetical protein
MLLDLVGRLAAAIGDLDAQRAASAGPLRDAEGSAA